MRPALRQARNLLNHDPHHIQPSIPIYLCPTLLKASPRATTVRVKSIQLHSFSTLGRARQQQALASTLSPETHGSQPPSSGSGVPHPARRTLPRACPGCGAPTQILDKNEAGFYNVDRRVVKEYLEFDPNKKVEETEEGYVYTKALKQVDPKVLEDLGLGQEVLDAPKHVEKAPETPVCDRCHNLIHHHVGTPIHHPTVESIQQTISESPHRHNHIYHVIDAADFPLSIIPNLQSSLRIPKLRTQNRRAKHKGWVANDRIAEVSFIITRADLLAPKKEQVDKLMPYVQDVLRDALGRANKLARLGNVRLVSAKRGWWTKQIKEDIWDRGGGGWMVGKVNVGKSNLFEVVFPKGRGAEYENIRKVYNAAEREEMLQNAKSQEEYDTIQKEFASAERQESLASLEAELGRLRKEVQDDLIKATIPKTRSAAEREKMLNAAKSLEDLAQAQRQIAEEDAELERYKKEGDSYVPKGRSASPTVHSATGREEMLRNAKSLEELSEIQKVFMEEDAVGERLKRLSELEAEIGRLKDASQSNIEKASEAEQSEEDEGFDPDALLPPPQPYTPYPVLPIASSLPGTTASPIRIPFGRNRGELIDLPGLARTSPGLETFVQAAEHDSLVMKHRINAPRLTLKPGQSLILGGGLIRITPVTEDLVFLVHPFVPIEPHVTRTDKAIDYQLQTSTRTLSTIVAPKTGSKMRSAGRFQLKWDVTKKLAGPLTSPVAAKMKPENLPFRVWSIDILIEGVGWVEVSAQTRRPQGWKPVGIVKKDPNHAKKEKLAARKKELEFKQRKYDALARAEKEGRDPQQVLMEEFAADREGDRMAEWEEDYPEIEVFTPLGKFVGARRPMCASMVSGPKRISSRERTARPRRSMVSVKRQRLPKEKLAANAGSA